MSKLSKLLNSPGLFFRDAIGNTVDRVRVRAKFGSMGTDQDDGIRRRIEHVDGKSPLADVLLRAIDGSADVFLSPSPSGYDDLNCFVTDVPWLVYHAVLLAESRKARLLVTSKRRTLDVNRREVGSVSARLMTATDFDLIVFKNGVEESVRVSVWEKRESEGVYYCRAQNAFARKLSIESFDQVRDTATHRVHFDQLFECPIDAECGFDVDVVYTWVNHADPDWRKLISDFRELDDVNWDRYRATNELMYSLRSLNQYAPWIRQIYVVTNCARPPWLQDHPKVRWVSHEDVYPPSQDYLPTFNSHSIESCLMRIDGLSEHFVYMNDDVFLGMPCSKLDFFVPNGMSISYLEGYGMVVGPVTADRPDYMNAAVNGQRLIEDTFGASPTQLHAHTPHALKKSVMLELEHRFPHEFDDVRRARFRSQRDISVASFLYHHYAFQTRHAVRASTMSATLVRANNSAEAYVDMLSGKRRRFFCINDGGASALDERFHTRTSSFLESYFPLKAPWES